MSVEERYGATLLQAWNKALDFSQLLSYVAELEAQSLWPLSAVLYQTWLKHNESPYLHAGYFNLGIALSNAGDLDGAEGAYRQAIALAPAFVHPRLNLANLYERRGQVDQALTEWRWVDENVNATIPGNAPLLIMALNSLGRVLETQKQYDQASVYLTKSLALDPSQRQVLHHWVYLREKQCLWPVYVPLPGVDPALMRDSTSALAMLSLSDDPAAQLEAARRYVEKNIDMNLVPLASGKGYGHKKIRIGYLSSDFSLHPVSMLTVQMFELHDRECFEVHGYCWSPEDGSAMRQRVIAAMDHFVRIHQMSDEQAARKIREDEIDVLVDLQGQTAGARPNILANRPAPIQITYLGLPATTGLPCVDYVIADRFLIPETLACHYSEKPLYMPDVYQVSDRKRTVGQPPTRAECGLPESGFVFSSFNNNYKYTPEMFSVWMNILKRVPNSVFWLLADNRWAQENLRQAAAVQGVDPTRLIFAGRVAPENYLARYLNADLFLDSFPFNAGTTANDALWMSLPVLTLSGRAFASRMAGALLTAAGLPELIVYDTRAYEEKAVALALNPDECRRLKETLRAVHENGVLFDTPLFVKNLETRLKDLVAAL
ncbi:tetratricopeptide repeat protein [Propionivibrio dicarboxylicus]|uniref:protein O-GlcNAc transferase n=1 Tax=Propionivibrio dicarboxylicus TaxID=83767 RepID=A0A1G8HAR5_9RHOO|nr:tetratricopeptide repeat protein [Propionivibrio dicarboxylicus]SDI03580.1 Predicted O-linked N-acetylglucosamine transferase, SPINDLY family [Propionivibrio dicarboxylicus]